MANISIFKKIMNWFKNLFQKQKKLEEKYEDHSDKIINNQEKSENTLEKEIFFEQYHSIKEGRISLDELSYEDLKKFNKMMDEEIQIKNQKLNEIRVENKGIETEIVHRIMEKERIQKQLEDENM